MKSIDVSTDVFAAIWRERKPDEHSENEVLERLLKCERRGIAKSLRGINEALNPRVNYPQGFYDKRHDVHFKEGFEIFKFYKGNEFVAIATKGKWKRKDTGEYFDTLNQLNETIVSGKENVWTGWSYMDGNKKLSINMLRK